MTDPTRTDAFFITAHEPIKSGYTRTFHCGVIAVDIEDAIRAFKEAHPTATLWTVSHRGQIEIITSKAMGCTVDVNWKRREGRKDD